MLSLFELCKHMCFNIPRLLHIIFYLMLLGSMLMQNLSAQPVNQESILPIAAPIKTVETASTHIFSLEDVYRISFNLEVRGNIVLISKELGDEVDAEPGTPKRPERSHQKKIDSDMIRVKLTKRYSVNQGEFQAPVADVETYLDNISLVETRKDNTLQLNIQFPNLARPQKTTAESPLAPIPLTTKSLKNKPFLEKEIQLNCAIEVPPDISVKLQTKNGDIRVQRIRGKIELVTDNGDVHLDETQGIYIIKVVKGRISGRILLTRGANEINTKDGSIALAVLDAVAAPLDLTAHGGGIELRLSENYPADVEVESERKQVLVNLPAQIEDDSHMRLNGGGPLLRLKTTHAISILPIATPPETESVFAETAKHVPKSGVAPVIDGNLLEKAWIDAAHLHSFQEPEGSETPANPTEALLMWDTQNFYIGVKAYFPHIQVSRVSQTQQDSPIWEDEAVEILLDPNPQTERYYHFVVNPLGAIFDQVVNSVGSPILRFVPNDVQWKTQTDATQTFKADSIWNSDAKVATRINATFWSLEIAIPRHQLEQQTQDTWHFNVHRKAQGQSINPQSPELTTKREYSYWLPTYDVEHPWWPHWKEALGSLKLVTPESQLPESFESEEKLRVTAIEILGNRTIPTEVVLKQLPIEHGDVITNSELSWLIAELENHDWFQEVRLETVATAPPSQLITSETVQKPPPEKFTSERVASPTYTLRIRLIEAPVQFAREIDITGNRSFPEQFIKEWFDLASGYLAVATVKLKQQLIVHFYRNRGYEFATVTHQFVNDVLSFSINEGSLDEIRFTGNKRISHAELAAALDFAPDDVYYRTLGQVKIRRMREQLTQHNEHFKSILDWRIQRDGRKNILIVDIEEQPLAKPGVSPIIGFNRVHGLVLGANGSILTRITGQELFFGSLSRGFSSRIWNYDIGIEKRFFSTTGGRYIGDIKLGAGYYKLTTSTSDNMLLPIRFNLGDVLYGTALKNYYQRHGHQAWITHVFGTSSQLRFGFTQERHDNLFKSTDWSYFNRELIKRGNSRIRRGKMRSLSLSYTFDTRDEKYSSPLLHNMGRRYLLPHGRTRRGWKGNFVIEMAGERLGGDYDFNLYKFELARYTPLFGAHYLNIRLAGDFSDAPLPQQSLLYLGGGDTVRGYPFQAFAGDRRMLLNIEYRLMKETVISTRIDTENVLGWAFSCFLDAGHVWWFDEETFSDFSIVERLKTAVGLGFSVFLGPDGERAPQCIVVELVSPVKDFSSFSSYLEDVHIIYRLNRMF